MEFHSDKKWKNRFEEFEKANEIGWWETDLKTGILTCSKGFTAIFERTEIELSSLEDHYLCYDKAYESDIKDVFSTLVEQGVDKKCEAKIITPSGGSKWIKVWAKGCDQLEGEAKVYGSIQDITEFKINEQERDLLLNNTKDVVLIVDSEFRIVTFNKPFKALTYTYFKKIPRKGALIFDYVKPEEKEKLKKLYQRVLNGEYENREVTYDFGNKGKTQDFTVIYEPIYGQELDNKQIIGAFITSKEITEQKRIELVVEQSEQRFKALVENGTDGVAILDKEGKITFVTSSIKQILGYSVEEISNKFVYQLIHPDDLGIAFEKFEKGLQNPAKPTEAYKMRILHKNGTYRWVESVVTNLMHEPVINGIVDNFRDVTDQYEAELKLEHAHQQLNKHLQNSPLGVVEYDKDLYITKWSKKCEEIFGWGEDEILGRKIHAFDLIFGEDRASVTDIASELKTADIEGNISNNRNYTKDGRIINCRWYNSVITDDKGEVVTIMSLVQDITHQVSIEKEQKKSIKEKSTMLAEIHHRVKNNLAIISGLMQLKVFNTNDKELSEVLLDSVSRIQSIALVHEQLYNSDDFQNIRFDQNLKKLVETISNIMNENGNIEIKFNVEPIKLTINQAVPSALFVNEAVTNVFKHAFDKGMKGEMTLMCVQKKEMVHISIADTGKGFNAERIPKESESLGLKLLQMMSEQLDGKLEINHRKGETSFNLLFPISN